MCQSLNQLKTKTKQTLDNMYCSVLIQSLYGF